MTAFCLGFLAAFALAETAVIAFLIRRKTLPAGEQAAETETGENPMDEGFCNIMRYGAGGEDGYGSNGAKRF